MFSLTQCKCFAAMAALACGAAVFAAPFVPASDDVVVETLRVRPLDRNDQDFRAQRALLRQDPRSLSVALRVAQRAIAIARRDSDPRYLGYAEAAVAPWSDPRTMPPGVQLINATLLQSNHQFDASLVLLNRILHENPSNAPAWLTRATVLQVQGHYEQAKQSCERVGALGEAVYAQVCLAELESLTGGAPSAIAELNSLVAVASRGNQAPPGWMIIVRAEMNERLGDLMAADRDYRAAVATDPDAYAKAAYADFLLDRRRYPEVITLLQADERADPLLLRLALAYQGAGDPRATAAVRSLAERFAAAILRGDSVHVREQSRFELHLKNNPALALTLAKQDWMIQREPADARVLLEAAHAQGDTKTVAELKAYLQKAGLTDQRLTELLR